MVLQRNKKLTTTAFLSFLTGYSPRLTAKNINKCFNGFTKGSFWNKRSIYFDFDERNHKVKCTAYNKHTTPVYTSFREPQSDSRWKQHQAQKGLASEG